MISEDPAYLSQQLITCIGNKRALLGQIGNAVERVRRRLGGRRLRVFDAFSGSGVVSRFLKAHSTLVISNDLEDYAAATARCYLRNKSDVDSDAVSQAVAELNARVTTEPLPPGFIQQMYAPKDDSNIQESDRVFYTQENARRLDNYCRLIEGFPCETRDLLLGPLLSEASIHANTAGVFKGFYKNRRSNLGQFGGSGSDALGRIMGQITLEPPVLSDNECDYNVHQEDANTVAPKLKDLDLAYIDPPYNQHPYGSNYFMLNLLVRYERPAQVSPVSGIPSNWRRSGYNVRSKSAVLLKQLIRNIDTRFLLVSSNNEGFVTKDEMRTILGEIGAVEVLQTRYNAFRGSRNFTRRSIHVTERLFLVERR